MINKMFLFNIQDSVYCHFFLYLHTQKNEMLFLPAHSSATTTERIKIYCIPKKIPKNDKNINPKRKRNKKKNEQLEHSELKCI